MERDRPGPVIGERVGYVHTSVMKEEVLHWLAPSRDGAVLVDGTLGEGGHSESFLQAFPGLSVIGLDADAVIQDRARERLQPFGDRMQFQHTWFDRFFAGQPAGSFHRILLDLGISIFHYQESRRGFSFSREERLDMRLDTESGESAWDLVNRWKEEDLANLIYRFGEERYSRRIARAILAARPVDQADQLAEVIYKAVPAAYRRGRMHPATRSFQALRIQVNHELERLDAALRDAFRCLEVGGRLGIITFHSLEDRAVKRYFQHLHRDCLCGPDAPRCTCGDQRRGRLCFSKPLVASAEEVAANAPSRSAKFRVIEKITLREAA